MSCANQDTTVARDQWKYVSRAYDRLFAVILVDRYFYRFRTVARTANALSVRGILQKESGVIHVIVDHLQDLSTLIAGGRYHSRDFQ